MPPLPAAGFLPALWSATREMFRSFVSPDLGLRVPPGLLTGLLVFGVFLVVAGSLAAAYGKAKGWGWVAVAIGLAAGAWVVGGGRDEVASFFVVITLVLAFLGGATFVLGFFRTPWIPAALLVCILLAATGLVAAGILGAILAVVSSVVGAWSLFRRFEKYSPGRRGSRWNQRSAAGWVVCLLASSVLEAPGLGGLAPQFKFAGIVVGLALLALHPRVRRRAIPAG